MINYRLDIQYDGTDFCGWQVQGKGERTVQGELTRVLADLDGRAVTVHGAGRTDSGVHADGQVANVFLEREFTPERLRAAINGNVVDDLRVAAVGVVPEDFNARFAATGKTYRYRIVNAKVMPPFWRRFALREARKLDLERMRECIPLMLGEHDWSAFSSSHTDVETYVRTLTRLTIERESLDGSEGRLLTITASAEGFIRYMVRGIVGALVAVGRGEVESKVIAEALRSGLRPDRCVTVAAQGLTLSKVHYD